MLPVTLVNSLCVPMSQWWRLPLESTEIRPLGWWRPCRRGGVRRTSRPRWTEMGPWTPSCGTDPQRRWVGSTHDEWRWGPEPLPLAQTLRGRSNVLKHNTCRQFLTFVLGPFQDGWLQMELVTILEDEIEFNEFWLYFLSKMGSADIWLKTGTQC